MNITKCCQCERLEADLTALRANLQEVTTELAAAGLAYREQAEELKHHISELTTLRAERDTEHAKLNQALELLHSPEKWQKWCDIRILERAEQAEAELAEARAERDEERRKQGKRTIHLAAFTSWLGVPMDADLLDAVSEHITKARESALKQARAELAEARAQLNETRTELAGAGLAFIDQAQELKRHIEGNESLRARLAVPPPQNEVPQFSTTGDSDNPIRALNTHGQTGTCLEHGSQLSSGKGHAGISPSASGQRDQEAERPVVEIAVPPQDQDASEAFTAFPRIAELANELHKAHARIKDLERRSPEEPVKP